MIYIGIGPNRGRVLETEEEALDYAITRLGLAPAETWDAVDKTLLLEYFSLADFFSGNWIACPEGEEPLFPAGPWAI